MQGMFAVQTADLANTILNATKFGAAIVANGWILQIIALMVNSNKMNGNFTRSPKSLSLALILTLLFGPLGLLYVTMRGGIIMLVIDVILLVTGLFIVIPVVNFICVIWAFKHVITYCKNLVDDDLGE